VIESTRGGEIAARGVLDIKKHRVGREAEPLGTLDQDNRILMATLSNLRQGVVRVHEVVVDTEKQDHIELPAKRSQLVDRQAWIDLDF
jgi:hypothetical protein